MPIPGPWPIFPSGERGAPFDERAERALKTLDAVVAYTARERLEQLTYLGKGVVIRIGGYTFVEKLFRAPDGTRLDAHGHVPGHHKEPDVWQQKINWLSCVVLQGMETSSFYMLKLAIEEGMGPIETYEYNPPFWTPDPELYMSPESEDGKRLGEFLAALQTLPELLPGTEQ